MEQIVYNISHGYFFFKIVPNEEIDGIKSELLRELVNVNPSDFFFDDTGIHEFIFKFSKTNELCYQLTAQDILEFPIYRSKNLPLKDIDFEKDKLFVFAGFGINHNIGPAFKNAYPEIHAFNFIFNITTGYKSFYYSYDNNSRDNFYEATAKILFNLVRYIRLNKTPFYTSQDVECYRNDVMTLYNNYVAANKNYEFKYGKKK